MFASLSWQKNFIPQLGIFPIHINYPLLHPAFLFHCLTLNIMVRLFQRAGSMVVFLFFLDEDRESGLFTNKQKTAGLHLGWVEVIVLQLEANKREMADTDKWGILKIIKRNLKWNQQYSCQWISHLSDEKICDIELSQYMSEQQNLHRDGKIQCYPLW